MNQMTISMLTPEIGRVPYYDMFYRNYSLLISANIITYHAVHNISEEDALEFFRETLDAAANDYKRAMAFHMGMGYGSHFPQINEPRSLDLTELIGLINTNQLSAVEALTTFVNINEFIILFATFEDAIKYALIQSGTITADEGLHEPKVVSKIKENLKKMVHSANFAPR